jgi:alpha-L-fucosidase
MIWFDGYGFPYGEYGKEVCWTLFKNSLKKNGKITTVAAGKISEDSAIVKDIESETSNSINPAPWQGIITSGGGWFYKKDREIVHNARTVI